ncbi:MAG: hypothetical protein OEY49_01375 [Candidatus Heimdallarchaeota archaeon]|nr:hypothetical protein [Candidatus Heimdallarchaeota archaeon]
MDNVIQTIKGKTTQEKLVSYWRHYPQRDHNIDYLVEDTLKDYRLFPSDVVKLSPQGRYCVEDFGCKIRRGSTDARSDGSSKCVRCIIDKISDWDKIKEIDPNDGVYGQQIKYVQKMSKQLPDIPMMMTIFSPVMVARKLSSNKFQDHLDDSDNYGQYVEAAFKIIENTTIEYAKSCIDAGSNGIFYAIQTADKQLGFSDSMMKKLLKLNSRVFQEIKKKSEFTVLHLHGDDVRFKESLDKLAPDAVNWHHDKGINFQEAKKLFKGGLFGGINPEMMYEGNLNKIIDPCNDLHLELPFIFSPSCVILQGTSDVKIKDLFTDYKK